MSLDSLSIDTGKNDPRLPPSPAWSPARSSLPRLVTAWNPPAASPPKAMPSNEHDDLSSRIRKLARSVAGSAVHDLDLVNPPAFNAVDPASPLSPARTPTFARSRENSNEQQQPFSPSFSLTPAPPSSTSSSGQGGASLAFSPRSTTTSSLLASPTAASPSTSRFFHHHDRHHHHLPMSPPTPEGGHVLNGILEEESEPVEPSATSSSSGPDSDANLVPSRPARGLGIDPPLSTGFNRERLDTPVSNADERESDDPGAVEDSAMFDMSPSWKGRRISLDGASLLMFGDDRASTSARSSSCGSATGPAAAAAAAPALGLSLHEQLERDSVALDQEDYDEELRTALRNGQKWFDLDLTFIDGEFIIGSGSDQPDFSRTLSSCYVEPLLRLMIDEDEDYPRPPRHLRSPSSSSARTLPSPTPSSSSCSSQLGAPLFGSAASSPLVPASHLPTSSRPINLVLTLDLRAPSPTTTTGSSPVAPPQVTYQYLSSMLDPLHDQGLLTTFCPNSRIVTKGPIVVWIKNVWSRSPSSPEQEDKESESLDDADEIVRLVRASSPRFIFEQVPYEAVLSSPTTATPRMPRQPFYLVSVDYRSIAIETGQGQAHGDHDGDGASVEEEKKKQKVIEAVQNVKRGGGLVKVESIPRFPAHVNHSIKSTLKSLGVDHVV
ncbi:hypothetical protein JCM10212_003944 [Sporobolomyces blumeae]